MEPFDWGISFRERERGKRKLLQNSRSFFIELNFRFRFRYPCAHTQRFGSIRQPRRTSEARIERGERRSKAAKIQKNRCKLEFVFIDSKALIVMASGEPDPFRNNEPRNAMRCDNCEWNMLLSVGRRHDFWPRDRADCRSATMIYVFMREHV